MVAVEVDAPHPWTPGVERFRLRDLWVFYGAKLERAQRPQPRPGWRRRDTPTPERRRDDAPAIDYRRGAGAPD